MVDQRGSYRHLWGLVWIYCQIYVIQTLALACNKFIRCGRKHLKNNFHLCGYGILQYGKNIKANNEDSTTANAIPIFCSCLFSTCRSTSSAY